MRLVWTEKAIQDLTAIRDYIARDNPDAASSVAARVLETVNLLSAHPEMGRSGRAAGTLEIVISPTPYVIVYRIHEKRLELLSVLHGKQIV